MIGFLKWWFKNVSDSDKVLTVAVIYVITTVAFMPWYGVQAIMTAIMLAFCVFILFLLAGVAVIALGTIADYQVWKKNQEDKVVDILRGKSDES